MDKKILHTRSMEIRIGFTDKEITPWGGMILFKRFLKKTGIEDKLTSLPLPTQGSNRGYAPLRLIVSFWLSVWCGASRFEHLEVTRQDGVLQKLFGWNSMAGHKAFQRYFRKFTQAVNHRVFGELFQWFFSQLQFDNYTLDLDSSVLTRYGNQEGAAKGYNPHKRGRKSHHPLMAFVADCCMVVNFWLRDGSSHTSNNVLNFLSETLDRLKGKTIGLLRGDSGFYNQLILNHLEDIKRSISYIIAVPFYWPIKRLLAYQRAWLVLDAGIEVADAQYQAPDWDKPRRMVLVRQHVPDRPDAAGRTLRLFSDEELYRNYRYSCFITNLTLPPAEIWRLYRQRAEGAENRIKELKEDFAAGSFNVQEFYATEAALNFVMMAYNLMSLFRQMVLQQKAQLKTLRYGVFTIGGYLVKEGNKRILKLSLVMKRRQWFRGLWEQAHKFSLPCSFP